MRSSKGRILFLIFNYSFLISIAFLCLLPLIHILAVSFSSASAASAGEVKLWPVEFTLKSYKFVADKPEFFKSFAVTIKRILLGIPLNMLLTVLAAYPLSKDSGVFKGRPFYRWYFLITMLFSGGLIPLYMTVRQLGLIDNIWAVVLPVAVPVFNIMLLQNFFRKIPKEIEEAVFIDGAGHWRALCSIYLPLSLPALATLTLFSFVSHWNAWFDGMIFMNKAEHYPLQSYLRTVVINPDMRLLSDRELQMLNEISDRTSKSAQIFVATFPILLVYPFLQKYFMKGIVVGSVKG